MVTTLSSREFNQDTGRPKRAAVDGPVIITDRGAPSHVLLGIEAYRRLTALSAPSISDLLSMPAEPYIEFEPPKHPTAPRGTCRIHGPNGMPSSPRRR